MAFDYGPIKATASSLLTNFGGPVVIMRFEGGTFDPITSQFVGGMAVEVSADAVLTNAEKAFANITEVVAGDQMALSTTPMVTGDRLRIKGAEWQVVAVLPVEPGPLDILYKALVRR